MAKGGKQKDRTRDAEAAQRDAEANLKVALEYIGQLNEQVEKLKGQLTVSQHAQTQADLRAMQTQNLLSTVQKANAKIRREQAQTQKELTQNIAKGPLADRLQEKNDRLGTLLVNSERETQLLKVQLEQSQARVEKLEKWTPEMIQFFALEQYSGSKNGVKANNTCPATELQPPANQLAAPTGRFFGDFPDDLEPLEPKVVPCSQDHSGAQPLTPPTGLSAGRCWS